MQRLQALLFTSLILCAAALSGCSAPATSGCSSDAECRQGRVCVDRKCQSPVANSVVGNNQNSNSGTNGSTVDPNNGTTNNANGDPNNSTTTNGDPNNAMNNAVDPDVELCEAFCDRLFGSCVDRQCMVTPDQRAFLNELQEQCLFEGFEGDPGCIEGVKEDPEAREQVEDFVAETACDSERLADLRCGDLQLGEACGCAPGGEVGSACSEDAQCGGGELPGGCATEQNEPPFPGGYCIAFGCELDPDRPRPEFNEQCGEENVCLPAGDQDGTGICLDGCFAHDECRPGYQCRLVGADRQGFGEFEPIRVCLAECNDRLRCRNPEERCNEGRCEFPCDDDMNNGPSGRMRCNALGFECVPDPNGSEWCVMP